MKKTLEQQSDVYVGTLNKKNYKEGQYCKGMTCSVYVNKETEEVVIRLQPIKGIAQKKKSTLKTK